MKKSVLLAALVLSGSALAARWEENSHPRYFGFVVKKNMSYQINELPLKAKLTNDRMIWSDTFWPSNLGGIAYRWNSEPNPQPFKYKLLSTMELKKLSMAELEKLSPTEKLDIYLGNTDPKSRNFYENTKKVMSLYSTQDLWWEGICHGWAQAAIHHAEPARREMLSRSTGVTVPFGSADVKALLDFYYANIQGKNAPYARLGNRCKVNGKVPGEAFPEDTFREMPSLELRNSKDCADVNAGAFHVTITNMIGRFDKGFIADVDRFNDVWNQPVGEYESEIVGEEAPTFQERSNGIVRKLRVKTKMTYGDELNLLSPDYAHEEGGFMSMDPVTLTVDQTFATRNYEYILELDSIDNIVGGTWVSDSRPDFIWIKGAEKVFGSNRKFDFSALNDIYKPVQ
jgi:hypothetical protein